MWVFGCRRVNPVRGQHPWRLPNYVKCLIGIRSFFEPLTEPSYFILRWGVPSTIGRPGTKLQLTMEIPGPRQKNWFLEIKEGEVRYATSLLSYPMELGLRQHRTKNRECGMPSSIAVKTVAKAGRHLLSSLLTEIQFQKKELYNRRCGNRLPVRFTCCYEVLPVLFAGATRRTPEELGLRFTKRSCRIRTVV